jgi:phosphate transport system substrate-binding protein
LLICLLGCAAGCATSPKVVRVGGEDAAINGFVVPVQETFEEENGIDLSLVRNRLGKELVDLQAGKVDVIVSEQPLTELLREAALKRVEIDPAALRQIEVGRNNTVVFLHRKNCVRKLTKKQLKAIFTGRIANWKKLGGADRQIVVVWNSAVASENETFSREILDGAQLVAKVVPVGSYEEVRTRVMSTPGAIGIAPRGLTGAAVKVPQTPVIAAPVIMVTVGEPAPAVQKLIDLMKDAQDIQ